VKTVGTSGEGIEALIAAIDQRKQWLAQDDRLASRRKMYWRERIEGMIRQALLKEARAHGLTDKQLEAHAEQVASGAEDPYRLVPELVAQLFEARGVKR
jgi:LAO/AO transport system kinase